MAGVDGCGAAPVLAKVRSDFSQVTCLRQLTRHRVALGPLTARPAQRAAVMGGGYGTPPPMGGSYSGHAPYSGYYPPTDYPPTRYPAAGPPQPYTTGAPGAAPPRGAVPSYASYRPTLPGAAPAPAAAAAPPPVAEPEKVRKHSRRACTPAWRHMAGRLTCGVCRAGRRGDPVLVRWDGGHPHGDPTG
jgi:hypothetical protein